MDNKQAWLKSVFRGFGGDNADYEGRIGAPIPEEIVVSVSWAMMRDYATIVLVNGVIVGVFNSTNGYDRYVQPAEALSLMGYEVHGTVNFSECVSLSKGRVIP